MIQLSRLSKGFSLFVLGLFLMSTFVILLPQKAKAVTATDWRPGRIIDDSVFFNKNSMDTSQIQQFLNAKVPVCDTNHNASFWLYGYWNAPPYTCLKDFSENGKTAAQIIWEAGQNYGINPQVLIVILQRESAIVTDTWAAPWQYKRATGYRCPDTALGTDVDANQNGCYDQYESFTAQVNGAAYRLRDYVNNPYSYNFQAGVTRNILWNTANTNCGSAPVYIETQGTAALYNYTPYQPNQAALNNLYGTGDGCSAYGNRNFWRMFNDWFGSTIGPNYAWQIVSFDYAGGDNFLAVGQTEHVVLKAKNIGRFPWYNHGNNPVRLGTWNTPDHPTTLLGTGAANNRFATVKESVVLPNEVGTFEFDLTPTKTGTFIEPMNLVAENSEWAGWPGFSPTIIVNNGYGWQVQDVIYGAGTGLMDQAQTQLITIKIKNTGGFTWSKNSGPPIRLGTWLPDRKSSVKTDGWISDSRLVTMNENSVAPGQVAGFQFYVKMPSAGTFYERLNLVAEGQQWFEDQGLTLYLQGKNYAWQPVWSSPSTGTYTVPKNTQLTLTIRAKNTGTTTWTKAGNFPVKIGTAEPVNRGSWLEDPSWLSSIRPSGLIEDSVAPGQEGTFSFKVKTPANPGTYVERFNLVAEGVAWFDDPNFKATFTVY